MARSAVRSLVPYIALWAGLSLVVGGGLYAFLRQSYSDHLEAAYRAAEADVATAEQAFQRAFDLASGMHSLLSIQHGLLDFAYSSAGIALNQHLRRTASNGRFGLVQMALVDAEGKIAWSTVRDAVGVSVGDRDHVQEALTDRHGAIHLSRPVIGRTSGQWSIQVSKPIYTGLDDTPVAVSVVSLDPVKLSKGLLPANTHEGRRIVVRRLSDGSLLGRSDNVENHLARQPDPDHPVVVSARQAASGRQDYASRLLGSPVLAAYRVPDDIPVVISALVDRDIEMRSYWLRLSALVLAYGVLVCLGLRGVMALYYRHDVQRLLRQHADVDPLTGLLNRRAMEQQARILLDETRRTGEALSVLLLDVDHFKAINDGHGHDAGDQVLRDLSHTIQQTVRADDLVCRWGGEEVLVLLRKCNRKTARTRAEDLRKAIENQYAKGGGPVPRVTASLGAATYPHDGADLGQLAHAADMALYAAKRTGRNRVMLFSDLAPASAAAVTPLTRAVA